MLLCFILSVVLLNTNVNDVLAATSSHVNRNSVVIVAAYNSNNRLPQQQQHQQYSYQNDKKYGRQDDYRYSNSNDDDDGDDMGRGDDRVRGNDRGRRDGSSSAAGSDDVVASYTTSAKSILVVMISAAICSALLTVLLTKMVVGKFSFFVTAAVAFAVSGGSHTPGNFGELSRALGVFLILLIRRASVHTFLISLLSLLKTLLLMDRRKPFPPSENPWSYQARPDNSVDTPDPKFSMVNALLAVVLSGSVVGGTIAKAIPLFPSWIGAIGTAAFVGYLTTLKDNRGDLFRFIGYGINMLVSEIFVAASDVKLKDKLTVCMGNTFSVLMKLDKQFKVIARIQQVLRQLIQLLSSWVSMIKSDATSGANDRMRDDRDGGRYTDDNYSYDRRRTGDAGGDSWQAAAEVASAFLGDR